jgi:hypothetical protein
MPRYGFLLVALIGEKAVMSGVYILLASINSVFRGRAKLELVAVPFRSSVRFSLVIEHQNGVRIPLRCTRTIVKLSAP